MGNFDVAETAHLAPEFGGQFRDPSVVAAYHPRPPYPPQVIDHLLRLRVDEAPVLDVGTGTGEIARAVVQRGLRVEALIRPRRCWNVDGSCRVGIIRF